MSRLRLNKKFEMYMLFYNYINGEDSTRYSSKSEKEFQVKVDKIYTESQGILEDLKSRMTLLPKFLTRERSHEKLTYTYLPYMFREYYQNTEDYKLENYLKDYLDEFIDDEAFKETRDPFELLNSANLTSSDKWDLFELFSNPKTIGRELDLIYSELEATVESFESIFEHEIEAMMIQWNHLIESKLIDKFFEENFGLSYAQNIDNYYYSIIGNNSISFLDVSCFIGVQFSEDYFDALEITEENAINTFKLLGDSSKYGILKQLLEEKKYGRELAESLGLSAATISYHMQELVNEGLVYINADKNSKRIYYSLKKDKIKEVLSYIRKDLELDEE